MSGTLISRFARGLVFLLAVISSNAQEGTEVPTTSALMEAAHKVGDLSSLGSYTLTAGITMPSKPKEKGTLVIYRDHEKQRIDIDLGAYRETRLVLGDHEYVRSQHALVDTAKLVNFDHSWDPTQRLNPEWETRADMWSDPSHRKLLNQDVWCVERMTRYGQSTLCFDVQNLSLLERTDPKIAVDFPTYRQIGQQFAPTTAIIKPEHVEEIDVSNIQINRAEIPATVWAPAKDAVEVERCETDSRPPHAIRTQPPDFPEAARRKDKEALVILYAVITSEGKVVMPQALGKDQFGFAEAARDATKHWKFEPASCAGQSVNVLMELEVDFRLGSRSR